MAALSAGGQAPAYLCLLAALAAVVQLWQANADLAGVYGFSVAFGGP